MSFDFERIWKGKRTLSARLAAKPIAEKLRMLDALRARALTLRGEKSAQTAVREEPQPRADRS